MVQVEPSLDLETCSRCLRLLCSTAAALCNKSGPPRSSDIHARSSMTRSAEGAGRSPGGRGTPLHLCLRSARRLAFEDALCLRARNSRRRGWEWRALRVGRAGATTPFLLDGAALCERPP
eukprot:scaffold58078_cov65-Phaeocystis_antarctica.AAC.7